MIEYFITRDELNKLSIKQLQHNLITTGFDLERMDNITVDLIDDGAGVLYRQKVSATE